MLQLAQVMPAKAAAPAREPLANQGRPDADANAATFEQSLEQALARPETGAAHPEPAVNPTGESAEGPSETQEVEAPASDEVPAEDQALVKPEDLPADAIDAAIPALLPEQPAEVAAEEPTAHNTAPAATTPITAELPDLPMAIDPGQATAAQSVQTTTQATAAAPAAATNTDMAAASQAAAASSPTQPASTTPDSGGEQPPSQDRASTSGSFRTAQAAAQNAESASPAPPATESSEPVPTATAKPVTPTPTPTTLNPTPHTEAARPTVEPRIATPPPPPPSAEARFAQQNVPTISHVVRNQLLPDGGVMELRLNPPELGAVTVMVTLRNGVMNAALVAGSERSADLLGQSLSRLRESLHTQGIQVERLRVELAPQRQADNGNNDSQQQSTSQQEQWDQRREQQRRELIRRMWAKLGGSDALDLVA